MQPTGDAPQNGWSRMLRRYGPVLGIVVVIAVVVIVVVVVGGGDDGDDEAADDGGATLADGELPEGVLPFEVAEEEGIEVDWPETCDTETGTLATIDFFSPPCVAPFEGDNGGATAPGVTGDTITIVRYLSPEVDPVLDYITAAIANDDTNADVQATVEGYRDYHEEYYETYGRDVELIFYTGTGPSEDEVAARADAVTIAEEHDPFMVWGGPLLTNAFAEELTAREIPCINCTVSPTQEFFEEADPYAVGVGRTTAQNTVHVAEYVGNRLAGDPAIHAGDEALQDQERVFGIIYLESGPQSAENIADLEDALAEHGVELAEAIPYPSPVDLQATADGIIAQLKDAGVTTVMFTGDPIAPADLTRAATAQEYFPEWLMTGGTLVDTNVFSRTYDQEQWANAFGISYSGVQTPRELDSAYAIYEWYHGEPPPADDSAGVLHFHLQMFYGALQLVGPDLTPQTWMDALRVAAPSQAEVVTAPRLSWGDHDLWPFRDYGGIDDVTEIWWDPDPEGFDELDRLESGVWRYVDGGKRYYPGEHPDSPPNVFVVDGSVFYFEELPPSEARSAYPSPAG